MPSPKLLRWLHRVGYVATVIVAAEAMFAGYIGWNMWARYHASKERDSTHIGAFVAEPNDPVAADAQRLMTPLPPLNALSDNSFRFVAMPSFGRQWFSISLSAASPLVRGTLVVEQRGKSDLKTGLRVANFSMPRAAYDAMLSRFDALSDGWGGDAGLWSDGTPIVFERRKAGEITSGEGNSGTHYGALAAIVRNGLAPYVPAIAAIGPTWNEKVRTGADGVASPP